MLVVIYLVSQLWRSKQVTAKVQVDSAHDATHRFCKQHRRPVNVGSLAELFFPTKTTGKWSGCVWVCCLKWLRANNGHPGFAISALENLKALETRYSCTCFVQ